MGIFDKLKSMAGKNADAVKGGMDKATDMVNEKTGGKFEGQIDMAKDKVGEMIDAEGEGAEEAAAEGE